jgi:hypothetical protein
MKLWLKSLLKLIGRRGVIRRILSFEIIYYGSNRIILALVKLFTIVSSLNTSILTVRYTSKKSILLRRTRLSLIYALITLLYTR